MYDGRQVGADGAPVAAGDNVVDGAKLIDGVCVGGQLILWLSGMYDGRYDGSALGLLGRTVGALLVMGALVAANDGDTDCADVMCV